MTWRVIAEALENLSGPQVAQMATAGTKNGTAMNRPDVRPHNPDSSKSIDAIAAKAIERLSQSSYPALRGLTCEFSNGKFVLHGRVPSYHLKQLVQTYVAQTGMAVVRMIKTEQGAWFSTAC